MKTEAQMLRDVADYLEVTGYGGSAEDREAPAKRFEAEAASRGLDTAEFAADIAEGKYPPGSTSTEQEALRGLAGRWQLSRMNAALDQVAARKGTTRKVELMKLFEQAGRQGIPSARDLSRPR